jgi:hypothetical protein
MDAPNVRFATLKDIGFEPITEKEKDILAVAIDQMPAGEQAGPAVDESCLPYYTAWYVVYSLLQYIERNLEH